jgi:hypothetical protein
VDFALGLLLEVVRRTAAALLAEHGELEPYAVKLASRDAEPVTYFPALSLPGSSQGQLFKAILQELRAPAEKSLLGVALVVSVDTEAGQHVFAAQIESVSYRLLALFRYWRGPDGTFVIAEPDLSSELMVSAGLDWPRAG